MKSVASLKDFFTEELAHVLSANNQMLEILPNMVDESQLSELKAFLEDHQEVSKTQVDRMKNIFSHMGQNSPSMTCMAMKSFIDDIQAIINETEKGPARDAAMISIAQRMTQYEIDAYQAACVHAADLGYTRIVKLLTESLNEERAMNADIIELAQQPWKAKEQGFYRP